MLQPVDHKIRQSGLCSHYIRYIDNFTIFGSNKRKLVKLLDFIGAWLAGLKLELKGNKQVYKVDDRMVSALGFRFDHNKTYIRKRNLLSIRRKVKKIQKKVSARKPISFSEASGLMSKLGQLKHCDSHHLVRALYKKGFIKRLKSVIRTHYKKKGDKKTWNDILLLAQTQVA